MTRSFADRLPAPEQLPELLPVPGHEYPEQLNAALELLDANIRQGRGDRTVVYSRRLSLTYAELLQRVEAVAAALHKAGLQRGDRVLLRTTNIPEFFVAWFALLRQGAIAVATMPLLRAGELRTIIDDCGARLAICHTPLLGELQSAVAGLEDFRIVSTTPAENVFANLEEWQQESTRVEPVQTRADDLAILAYTSGTTGIPKGTVHVHRDLLAIADTYSQHILRPTEDDVFSGHPTLAFTFGLGGLLIFPMRVGASAALLEQFTPQAMLEAIRDFKVTIAFCTPTSWKMMMRDAGDGLRGYLPALRLGVSAGETLPGPVLEEWKQRTGLPLLDGIGATEMLHIFITNAADDYRPGATGKPVPGYRARIVDDQLKEVPDGTPGLLAVQGPTGCRYWQRPEAQRVYVRGGWNFPGDIFVRDPDGYFHYSCRADDMIICGGNNISGIEVENILLKHAAVEQVAVVASPDELKGFVPKAFVVLASGKQGSQELGRELQEFVKQQIAPYKYPRLVEFVGELPRTGTGKIRRNELRARELKKAEAR